MKYNLISGFNIQFKKIINEIELKIREKLKEMQAT